MRMGNCLGKNNPPTVEDQLRKLYSQYSKHLLPLEQSSLFNSLGDPPYSLADVLAKPMILMMGQYSTGKTTFIRALLGGREYPGMHIAAEMSTDNFVAVLRGPSDDFIPGNALVNNTSHPFHSLKAAFGENFLQRFRGSYVSNTESEATDILDDVIIVDTPGTLDGSSDRNYNFAEAMGWFARRSALIIIFFDVNKMGVSTEMKSVLDNIQGNEEKIRIVFNKADTVDERDMAGSLAGLRHNLAKSMPTPEVPEVYVTSLDSLEDSYKTENKTFVEWFSKDKVKLVEDIRRVRFNTYSRKLNILDKRARMVRNHAYVMMKLREEQRKCLTLCRRQLRVKDTEKLISILPDLYRSVQQEQNRSTEEFISVKSVQDKLKHQDLNKLPRIKKNSIEHSYGKMEQALTKFSTVQVKSEEK
jgi:EH domain-containing protein 1